jgi:hypothetical protein
VTEVRKLLGRLFTIAGTVLVLAPAVVAQPIFNSASGASLAGTPGDALPILVLADVGSPPPTPADPPGPPDGKLDIITALQGPMMAYVLFGKGDGTFPTDNGGTLLNRIPTALLVADFDGGGADLVVADTGSVAFMHGNNDGSFNLPPDATPVNRLCCTDAVGRSCSTKACSTNAQCTTPPNTVCANVWDCSSGQTCFAPVGAQIVALGTADVNHDGKLDVVVVDTAATGGVMILLGDGNGNFRPGTLVPGAGNWAVATGHFTSGGFVDLAVTNRNANSVTILRGDGTGAFTLSQTLSTGTAAGGDPVAITSGDLTGDGRPDLVVVNETADNIAVFLAQADGSFQAAQFFDSGTQGSGPNGVTLVDVNGDGKLDAVVSNGSSSDVSTLLGDGTGKFGPPRAFVADQEPVTVAAGKLNADTSPDVVAIAQDGQAPRAMVLIGNGDGTYAAVENVMVPPNPKIVVTGDVDNDGLPDLVVVPDTQSPQTGTVLILRALATGGFAAPVTLQSHGGVTALGTGDFNGDGQLDIVALNASMNDVSVFWGSAPGLPSKPRQDIGIGAGAVALAVGDWDGNGQPDLAIIRQSGSTGAIDVLLSNSGSFQTKPSITLASAPQAIAFGDFDNNGKLDLVTANGGASKLSVLHGNGDGTFQAAVTVTIPGVTGSANSLAVADFDGNGADDIAVLVPGSDQRAWVLYGPDFTTPPTGPLSQEGPPSMLVARDLTGDLVPDLLVADQGQTNAIISYRYNRTSKAFAKAPNVTVGRMPASLATADFDGDGRYDAAAADDQFAGTVSVLTNIAATPAIIRGDGNGDGKVSAADLVAVARQLGSSTSTRVEKLKLADGTFPNAKPGADANGDSVVTGQDTFAIAHRLFPRL